MTESSPEPTRRFICKYCARKIDIPTSTFPAPIQDKRTGHFCVYVLDNGEPIKPIQIRRQTGEIGADPDIGEFMEMRTSILDPERRRKP